MFVQIFIELYSR